MSLPPGLAKQRFFIYSFLLVGTGLVPLLFMVLSVVLAPHVAWTLLGLWALIVFLIAFLQMHALVVWLNPPEQSEKDS